jgi:hypothetical protein
MSIPSGSRFSTVAGLSLRVYHSVEPILTVCAERGPSPSLQLNLSSNNPFRNRAASPTSPTTLLPSPKGASANARAVSKNPFVDIFDGPGSPEKSRPKSRDPAMASSTNGRKQGSIGSTGELFENLYLSRSSTNDENTPLTLSSKPRPQTSHRPSRSQEEDAKYRRGNLVKSDRPNRGPPQDSGRDRERRRPRRNSDTSVRSSQHLDPEDRRRDRRDRRGELRRVNPFSTKPKKPNHHLDIIDKLDVTSIYGTGCKLKLNLLICKSLIYDSIPSRWSI